MGIFDDLIPAETTGPPRPQGPFTSRAAFDYLQQSGYSPAQAAALVGNMRQESSFNPNSLNVPEGAFGLIQWRQGRRTNLENFARERGTSADDPYTQLDFIGPEMRGAQAKKAAPFLAATDVPSANAALRRYIRYGDDSEGTRLGYASEAGGGPRAAAAPASRPAQAPAPTGGIFDDLIPREQPQTPEQPSAQQTGPFARGLIDFLNMGPAAAQGTTSSVGAHAKNLVSDQVHISDVPGEYWYRDKDTGNMLPMDPS